MMILALYIPKPEEFAQAIVVLVVLYFVLCGVAYRMKLSVPLAAVLMLVGCRLALTPLIVAAAHAEPGPMGNLGREWSKTNHSDAFFAFTAYMHVGPGKLIAFGGMSFMLVCHAVATTIRNKMKRPADDLNQADIPAKDIASNR